MPIHHGIDSKGHFFQWGHQKKYYFNPNSQTSTDRAYGLALKQMKAIFWSRGHTI